METEKAKCPAGGIIGDDYTIYPDCLGCQFSKQCQRKHDRRARDLKQDKRLPLYLTIPRGLFTDKTINAYQREIISLVAFRTNTGGKAKGTFSYDKNRDFAFLFHLTEGRISQLVSDLIERGYLNATYKKIKRERPENSTRYRTSRRLGLGVKAARLINLYKETKDRLKEVTEL